jgi:hypothetical protein
MAKERGTVDVFESPEVIFLLMPHEFTQREEEPEAQAAGSRYGSPPRKHTAIAVLDPPVPPKKPIPPTPAIPRTIFKFLTILVLVGLALAAAMMIWKLL